MIRGLFINVVTQLNFFKFQKKLIVDEEDEEARLREESGLIRTGRLFGGLINDIKRKKPFYW